MDRMTKEEYISRIRMASPVQLIIITYELILVNLEDAKQNLETQDYQRYIKKSQDFLMQLMTSLDMTYPISDNLLDIYLYVNKVLHEVYFSKNINKINECLDIMHALLDSFEVIKEKEDFKEPVVRSSQKVYAGLTYKNGELEELVLENSQNTYMA